MCIRDMVGKKALAAFFLTDEAYAVSYAHFQREKGTISYILGAGLDIYLFWAPVSYTHLDVYKRQSRAQG